MRKHIPGLDGVRGLAILLVMFFHVVLQGSGVPRSLTFLASVGQTGVALFFVLSGFLITRILLEAREEPHYFSYFYLRRGLRIFPLYYAFLAFYCLTRYDLGSMFSKTWWCWVYLQNIPMAFLHGASGPPQYWSLAVEEHFYLVWPLVVLKASRRTLNGVCVGMVLVSVALQGPLSAAGMNTFFFTPTRVDGLALGALLAVNEPWIMGHRPTMNRFFGGAVLLFGTVLALSFFRYSGQGVLWVQIWKYAITSLLYAGLVGLSVTANEGGWVGRLFGFAPLRYVGSISYGLYVLHLECFERVSRILEGADWRIECGVCLAVAFAAATVSFYFFERPFLRLKQRFEPGVSAPRAARRSA